MNLPAVRWVPTAPSDSVASARLRAYRPAAALAEAGWDSAVVRGRRTTRSDIVVFQKAYDERHLRLVRRLRRRGTTVVFDLCDNHFYNPNNSPVRAARADRLRRMIGLADVVTVSTPQLAAVVEHPVVHVVDDALEPTRALRNATDRPASRLIWFGNSGSADEGYGMHDLGAIVPTLESLARRMPLHLTVLSNSRESYDRYVGRAELSSTYEPWTLAGRDRALASADIALLPMAVNDFTRTKTSNRVVMALQSGLAVVADRIPSYEEFGPYVRFGAWEEHVAEYLTDGPRRAADVDAGQRYITERFPVGHLVRQWTDALVSRAEMANG